MTLSYELHETPAFLTLKEGHQWVCYKYPEKVPLKPWGNSAYGSSTEPNTWGPYIQALEHYQAHSDVLAGIGRCFVKEQCITGVDLDKCFLPDGSLTPQAQRIVNLLNSYTEKSPSGRGLHIWVRGSIPRNIGNDPEGTSKIEMYDCKRFFTWTGDHLDGTPLTIEDRQEALLALYNETIEARQEARQQAKRSRYSQADAQTSTQASAETARSDKAKERYVQKALEDECAILARAVPGSRNHQLNKSAYALGQLVGAGCLSRSEVEAALTNACMQNGLLHEDGEFKMRATMRSGLDAGKNEPRKPKERERKAGAQQSKRTEQGSPKTSDDLAERLCQFDPDDTGNSDAMNLLHGKEFLYCSSIGWLYYKDTHWHVDTDTSHVKKCAIDTLRKRRHAAVDMEKEAVIKCSKGDEQRVNACVNLFKTHVSISIECFDNDPDRLNCKNGVIDLRTGNLEPHTYLQRFTYCVPVPYEPAVCHEWIDFLQSVVGGGNEVIDYLQMAVGYSLTGHTREEILFYLFGPSRSGKGTFTEPLMTILPSPLSTMVDFNSFTAKREGDVNNFDLAPLKPSRLIFASESNRSQSLNPAKIKQLTGGDRIRASFKHRDFFAFSPQFKVWMLSNWPVNGDPEDNALWGRVRVIEFPNSFLGKEDKTKKARLKSHESLKGILYWAVQGAIKWYSLGESGLSTPAHVEEVTNAQRAELDYVQQWLDECYRRTADGWISNEDIMTSYKTWCDVNNVQYPKGAKGLAQSLKAKGYQTGVQRWQAGKNQKGVAGLTILTDANVSQNEPLDATNEPVESDEPHSETNPNGSNVWFPGFSLREKYIEKGGNQTLEPLGFESGTSSSHSTSDSKGSNELASKPLEIARNPLGSATSPENGTKNHLNTPQNTVKNSENGQKFARNEEVYHYTKGRGKVLWDNGLTVSVLLFDTGMPENFTGIQRDQVTHISA